MSGRDHSCEMCGRGGMNDVKIITEHPVMKPKVFRRFLMMATIAGEVARNQMSPIPSLRILYKWVDELANEYEILEKENKNEK